MSKNQELADFIWPVADLLRGDHVRPHKRHVPSNLEGSTFKDAFHRAYFGVTSDDFEYEPLMIHSPTCEVIGNIYEHPDLLK